MIGARAISWWRFIAMAVVVTAAYSACVGPAVFGHGQWTIGGAIGGLVGGLAGARSSDTGFWRLSVPDRRRVLTAARSGTPTWDVEVDLLVLDQLERAARHARSQRPSSLLLGGLLLALPVLAAVRTGTGWYLLCLLPMAVPVSVLMREAVAEDPRTRLARFRAAVDEDPVSRAGSGR